MQAKARSFLLWTACQVLGLDFLQNFLPQGLAGGLTAQKKQREVYVGNLTIGVVTDNHLKELFNGALSHLMPDPHNNPPVVSAQLDPSGGHPSESCVHNACICNEGSESSASITGLLDVASKRLSSCSHVLPPRFC